MPDDEAQCVLLTAKLADYPDLFFKRCNRVRQTTAHQPPFRQDCDTICDVICATHCPLQVVLVTSVGTDSPFFPLNLLWGVLFWKKRAEEALQRSGLDYTIIRPGGTRRSSASVKAV